MKDDDIKKYQSEEHEVGGSIPKFAGTFMFRKYVKNEELHGGEILISLLGVECAENKHGE